MKHVPNKPNGNTKHIAHHRALHERVFEGGGLVIAGPGIALSVNEFGQYVVTNSVNPGRGGSGFFTVRGEYDPAATYALYEVVVISTGMNQGTFVCIAEGTTGIAPYTGGGYWMQLPGGLLGQWM